MGKCLAFVFLFLDLHAVTMSVGIKSTWEEAQLPLTWFAILKTQCLWYKTFKLKLEMTGQLTEIKP